MNDATPTTRRGFFRNGDLPTRGPVQAGAVVLLATLVSFQGVALGAQTTPPATRATYEEEGGAFGDGTRYLMRVPSNWNGTLIRDLDYASNANSDRYLYLLERGYAVSGTARHDYRWVGGYDPVREIDRIDQVHDVFIEHFGQPRRVIQLGCSGGGRVGTLISERSPGRVDGVIAGGTQPILWLGNTKLDKWFVMQALLAPELPIVDLPRGASLRPNHPEITFAWRQVINQAQRTPEGRARIALAITIGQIADRVDPTYPNPDRTDVIALQESMYQSALEAADRVGGVSRYMLESSPGFGARSYQISWNDGVDYAEFFENGNEHHKRAVRQLYEEAGVSLESDLRRVNAFPRVTADPEGVEYWGAPGRISVGNPQIPLIRWHDVGDNMIPASNVQGYMDLVRSNGKEELVRTVITEGPTHCSFTVAEVAAVLETLMNRLDTGSWGSTEPEDLNRLGRSLDGSVTRFITLDERYRVGKYNRTWIPGM